MKKHLAEICRRGPPIPKKVNWWDIIKVHPRLVELLGNEDEKIVQLANEAEVVELFNASNPQVDPYETRAAKGLENDYPIDTFLV